MKDKKYLNVTYNNFEQVNEEFVKCTISVLSCSQVANGTKFNKDGVERAKESLNYAPVIGYFKGDDFADHGIRLAIEDEEIKEVVKTVPFGVCIKDSSRWENIQKPNGEYEEYLVVDAYLWNRYNDAISVVKENKCNQSMEISVQNGEYSEGCYNIKEFSFSALCILGENVQPAFNLAKIRTSDKFSKDELKDSYKEMLDRLSYTLDKAEEPVIEEPETQEPNEEPIIEIEPTDKEPVVEEPVITEEPIVEEPITEEPVVEEPTEPVVNYEAKYNEVIKELEELKVSYVDLQTLHEKQTKELEELRLFKQQIEHDNHVHEVDEALAPYSELEEVEGYAELVKDKYEADLEELIKDIKIFCFDNNIVLGKKKEKKSAKENKIKIPVINNSKTVDTNPDWSFMSKYKKNK